MADADFGDDYSTFLPDGTVDIDLSFTPITGPRCIAEAVGRRWTTQRGGAFWAPNMGIDYRRLVNADYDTRQLRQWEMALSGEARKVQGVRSITVTITPVDEHLEIRGDLLVSSGERFSLMFSTADAASAVRLFIAETTST